MEQIVDSLVAQLKHANQELQACKAQLDQANKLHRNQLDEIHDEQARDHIHSQQLMEELNRVHTENLQLQSELKLHVTSYKEATTRLAEEQHKLVKLKEDIETLRKENAELQGDLEAQRMEVRCSRTKLHQYLNCQMHLAFILLHVRPCKVNS